MRASWLSLIEQGLASGCAFLGVLALARVLGAAEFGTFAIPFTLLTLVVGVGRAYFGVPLALKRGDPVAVARLRDASTSALLIAAAPIVAVVAAAGGLASWPGGVSDMELLIAAVVAVASPLVVAIDICRYTEAARGRVGASIAADTVWLVGVIALLAFGEMLPPEAALAGWLAAMIGGTAAHVAVTRPGWDLTAGRRLLRPAARLGDTLAISVVLATGVTLVMAALMLVVLGPVAVAAIRGAGTLFGPINTAITALDLAVLGGMAERPATRVRATWRATSVLMAASAVWWIVLLVLPASLGEQLLGATWGPTREILPITGAEYLLLCLAAGLALLSKSADRGRDLLANRIGASIVIVGVAGAALLAGGGIVWMASALLAGAVVSAAHLLVVTTRSAAEERRLSSGGGAPGRERDVER